MSEFARWLRDAIAELECVRAGERDEGDYDYCQILASGAEHRARMCGGQAVIRPAWGPVDTLAFLGECLAWCEEQRDRSAPQLLTPEQTAQRLAVSPRTLWGLRLPTVTVGRRSVRYDETDLRDYIERQKNGEHQQ